MRMDRSGRAIKTCVLGMALLTCLAAARQPGLAAAPAVPAATSTVPAATSTVPAREKGAEAYQMCHSWKHHGTIARRMSRRIRAVLTQRESFVAVRVDDPFLGIGCWLRAGRHFDSASVVKATILAALMRKAHAHHRRLSRRERDLARLMITRSDNHAATALYNDVGLHSLERFLDLAGMDQTVLRRDGFWGLTRITAHDEMILLQHLLNANTVLTTGQRHYELRLMANVIPAQRWGVPAGAPDNFTVHVKNGWAPLPTAGSPWWINSIGCLTHLNRNYSIVVLTEGNPDMSYGVTTVEDVAEIINHYLNPGAASVIPRSRPFPSWGTPDEPFPPHPAGR